MASRLCLKLLKKYEEKRLAHASETNKEINDLLVKVKMKTS